MTSISFSRRKMLAATATATAAALAGAPAIVSAAARATAPVPTARPAPLLTRRIPRTGEALPVIGLGTPLIFDYANDPARHAQMTGVIQALVAAGGRMIDTASGYGKAEPRIGEILSALKARDQVFLCSKATVLEGVPHQRELIQGSLAALQTKQFDLLYSWGVRDANYDLALLRDMKAQGVTRYIGITNGRDPDLAALETLIRREKPDFLYFGYSIGDRAAEERLFPAARDAGTAVVGTVPFGGSSLFRKVAGKPLPPWAAELGIATWAQFFLKFVLANPAIVTIVPGTDKVANLEDNLQAGRGAVPDAAQRQRMIDYWNTVAG